MSGNTKGNELSEFSLNQYEIRCEKINIVPENGRILKNKITTNHKKLREIENVIYDLKNS